MLWKDSSLRRPSRLQYNQRSLGQLRICQGCGLWNWNNGWIHLITILWDSHGQGLWWVQGSPSIVQACVSQTCSPILNCPFTIMLNTGGNSKKNAAGQGEKGASPEGTRALGCVTKRRSVCPTHSEARQTESSEFGPEKGLLRGLCKEVGRSCPEKPRTPWKVLAKHFSRQGGGGTRRLLQTSFSCVCVCEWVFLPPNFF